MNGRKRSQSGEKSEEEMARLMLIWGPEEPTEENCKKPSASQMADVKFDTSLKDNEVN